MQGLPDLLEDAIGGGGGGARTAVPPGKVVLVEDCVETSGAFLLHLLLKRSLSPPDSSVVFLGLAQPFHHYYHILRKMGCNLSMQKTNGNLQFLDSLNFSATSKGNSTNQGLVNLYTDIRKAVEASRLKNNGCVYIMIDDLSLLEIASNGSQNDILDFLHYCTTLTSEMDCSVIILSHEDVYSSEESFSLLTHLHYISDIIIKASPLSTGLAADVHGQMAVVNKESLGRKVWNFQFKVRENGVDFFYPGTRN
ncbi:hypothetical protein LUZ60_013014 [Juncus effusus]|nr:hypothetical protein LUZ60_013014 [Juncus effusus]